MEAKTIKLTIEAEGFKKTLTIKHDTQAGFEETLKQSEEGLIDLAAHEEEGVTLTLE